MAYQSGQVEFQPQNQFHAANVHRAATLKDNQKQYVKMAAMVANYNADPDKFSDAEAEKIALVAKTIGLPFQREYKPLRNLMYGAAEGLSFGLAPDSWQPSERGESVYGRSFGNKLASGVGMVAGGLGGLRAGAGLIGMAGRGAAGVGGSMLGGLRGGAAAAGSATTGVAGMAGRAGAATRGAAQTGYQTAANFGTGVKAGYAGTAQNIAGPGFVMGPTAGTGMAGSAGVGLGGAVRTGVNTASPYVARAADAIGPYATRASAFVNPYVKAADARMRSMWFMKNFYGGTPQQQGLVSFM